MRKRTEKFLAVTGDAVLLFIASVVPAFATTYLTFSGAIVGLLTAYLGSHVGHALVDAKAAEPEAPPPNS